MHWARNVGGVWREKELRLSSSLYCVLYRYVAQYVDKGRVAMATMAEVAQTSQVAG